MRSRAVSGRGLLFIGIHGCGGEGAVANTDQLHSVTAADRGVGQPQELPSISRVALQSRPYGRACFRALDGAGSSRALVQQGRDATGCRMGFGHVPSREGLSSDNAGPRSQEGRV